MTTSRTPEARGPARIAPLATLPLFHKLSGRKVVLAGDSDGALWKAELLAASGADLMVFAPERPELFSALVEKPPAGRINVIARPWQAPDLEGARFAVADVGTDEEAERFVAAARAAGALVNVVDRPAFCDAQFGALVNRSPLVVAISTDGAAPVFGQAIRTKIEAVLPMGLKAWAEAARDWRPFVQARDLAFAARRAFWERFTKTALEDSARPPDESDREAMLAALATIEAAPPSGRVTLVGAGPGDPELLTLKAVRALQAADVILYDDLVSDGVLELARREAERMLVGKTGHGPSCKQADINATMVALALAGRHVIRLKSGDPLVFGRATEEIEACAAAGIPVEIVPGVTSAQGAAAELRISLTERKQARRVQFLTGHGADGKLPTDISWAAIADPGATTVLYMPRKTLAEFRDRAVAAGLDPETPAVGVSHATRASSRAIFGTITTLPDRLGELPADGPLLVMIGAVLRDREVSGALHDGRSSFGASAHAKASQDKERRTLPEQFSAEARSGDNR
jgi:uroporphyrin-III C-methyltransferase / precorrin-2 dehydrogenase / sirohydrochlorin ferrochelatase